MFSQLNNLAPLTPTQPDSVCDQLCCVGAGESELSRQRWMFQQQALQEYILLCCQNPAGGLLDKPGKSVPVPVPVPAIWTLTEPHCCTLSPI